MNRKVGKGELFVFDMYKCDIYVLLDACSSLRWQCQWSDCFTVNFYLELYHGGKEVEAVKKKS